MTRDVRRLQVRKGEEGHAGPLPGMLVGAAGAIALGIGAAAGLGWLSIAGGVGLALGIVASFLLNHVIVEYDIYARLESLEKK
jgi:hypothetical protein